MTEGWQGSSLRTLFVLSVIGGSLLFVVNSLAILAGVIGTPDGYAPSFVHRNEDTAQYLTWATALQQEPLIPNYHAPWRTEAGFFTVFASFLAILSRASNIPLSVLLLIFHFFSYILAAYALCLCLKVFTATVKEAVLVLLVALAVVPLHTNLGLFWNVALPTPSYQGLFDFVYASSDGFFHGIAASPMVTFGTATALLALGMLGRYLQTGQRRYLYWTAAVVYVNALVHPFEVWVILGAAVLALAIRWRHCPRVLLVDVLVLIVPAGLGVLPYVWQVSRHDWIREVAERNRWYPGSPLRLMSTLGLPAILVLGFARDFLRRGSQPDLLLKSWYAVTLAAVYLPGLPWAQHLLDGFHYVTALLLVRLTTVNGLACFLWSRYPRVVGVGLAAWLAVCLIPHIQYRAISFSDGAAPQPRLLFSAVTSNDEAAVIRWMRANASPRDLVLAPIESAPWLATVPMHSLGSHWLFSISYRKQTSFLKAFHEGRLDENEARSILAACGMRFAVIRDTSPAVRYLRVYPMRAQIGELRVYETSGSLRDRRDLEVSACPLG